jgi:O-antigen/teichoic acid export membrane protein
VRGEYAAVLAWFGTVLVVGQLGQTAATTYFVARDPDRAPDYLATARRAMVLSGSVTLVVGILATPALSSGDATLAWGYRLMFATCLACFVGAAYTFTLQAVSTPQWNLSRLVQPVAFIAAIVLLNGTGRLGLLTALGALSTTIVAQTILARTLCRRQGLAGGRYDRELRRPLSSYGLSQLAASVPELLTARLDQLLLSLTVAPAALGHYAVANSLTVLAVPVVSAVGNVAFPRLAAQNGAASSGGSQLPRQAVLVSLVVSLALIVPLVCLASWLVPAVFGDAYRPAVGLILLLAPGGICMPCIQVCGDLLRGYGRPLDVARAQGMGALATVVLLATLVPLAGAAGAAVASSAASVSTMVLLVRRLRRAVAATLPAPRALG